MSTRAQTASEIGAMLDGNLADAKALAWLDAHPLEALTAEQLAGATDAVMARMVPFSAFPDAVDCCGTGGDGLHSYNVSTAVAFVAAAAGVVIAKHGNRAVSSTSGSADVLEALGVNTRISATQTESILRELGIAFLFAPTFHPSFARIAPLRKQLARRTLFNLLGPLCNPARTPRQVIGIFSASLASTVAEACMLLGKRDVMVVHGGDGSDELTTTVPSTVCHLREGAIHTYSVAPADHGLSASNSIDLKGGNAEHNAHALRMVLAGEPSAYADSVALNTAAVLMVAGHCDSLAEGVVMAQDILRSGRALTTLEHLLTVSRSYV